MASIVCGWYWAWNATWMPDVCTRDHEGGIAIWLVVFREFRYVAARLGVLKWHVLHLFCKWELLCGTQKGDHCSWHPVVPWVRVSGLQRLGGGVCRRLRSSPVWRRAGHWSHWCSSPKGPFPWVLSRACDSWAVCRRSLSLRGWDCIQVVRLPGATTEGRWLLAASCWKYNKVCSGGVFQDKHQSASLFMGRAFLFFCFPPTRFSSFPGILRDSGILKTPHHRATLPHTWERLLTAGLLPSWMYY